MGRSDEIPDGPTANTETGELEVAKEARIVDELMKRELDGSAESAE